MLEPDRRQGDGVGDGKAQALRVVRRVKTKLLGTDFSKLVGEEPLEVPTQVDRLISEAQSHTNLCFMYIGWNPFW